MRDLRLRLPSCLASYTALLWMLLPGPLTGEVIHVPADVPDLQTAIDQAVEGDIVELAGGTYLATAAPNPPFRIINQGKAFTVRAAAGATVVLDGGGVGDILRLRNSGGGRPVVFEDLIFDNGFSNSDGLGSVLVDNAVATFLGCTFRGHSTGQTITTGSGAAHIVNGSTAFFSDSLWEDNSSKNAGAGLALQDSVAWVHRGRFVNNRTNLANHRTTAVGGAIHAGNSFIRVSNSRFDSNQAGYTGGAVLVIGDYQEPISVPRAGAEIANSTFVDNRAERHPTVVFPFPTEGGAFHAENQSLARIYHSRFLTNLAEKGGGVNLYRATVEVHDSVFRGNRAAGTDALFGGALAAVSNDTNNATTGNGAFNRPSAHLTVKHSLIQGRFGGVTTVAATGGGIFVAGDNNRAYGVGGVDAMGTPAENRATLIVEGVVFSDLDVEAAAAPAAGKGGGLSANLIDLTLQGSLFADCDTAGPGAWPQGGGVLLIGDSGALVEETTFADNTARIGAGLNLQGSVLTVDGNRFFDNEIVPADAQNQSHGAALHTGPYFDPGLGLELDVVGTVRSSTLSDNVGLPIWDEDRDGGPINDVQYDQNSIYSTTFGNIVYKDSLSGPAITTGDLNALVVVRGGAPNTIKSIIDNIELGAKPSLGELIAVPRKILPATAAGDSEAETSAYLGWAWSGGSAVLDSTNLTAGSGLETDAAPGGHSLNVDGNVFAVNVVDDPGPSASFTASPPNIEVGGSSTLSWSVDSGTLVELAIDQDVAVTSAASGSVVVSPSATTTYRLFVLTEEGGTVEPVTVTVGSDLIFADGFESGDTGAWTSGS